MKQLSRLGLVTLFLGILFGIVSCSSNAPIPPPNKPEAVKNQFQAVWNEVTSDVLNKLPQNTATFEKLIASGKNVILGDAKRTINEHANILKPFDKLAHPNGICLKGSWNIHANSRYGGYFKKNSKALIIVRASTAMSTTKRGEIRAFGFAGKIFPTTNPRTILRENAANFFLVDDLGGTRAKHYTDVALTNEPFVSKTSEVFKNLSYVIKLASAFSKADKHASIRQLYEISELGEGDKNKVVTPKWMKIEAKQGQTVDAIDFRDELRITGNKKLHFSISVASKKTKNKKAWMNIGSIIFDASVVSNSCDHRLHFHHPKWKDNLKH